MGKVVDIRVARLDYIASQLETLRTDATVMSYKAGEAKTMRLLAEGLALVNQLNNQMGDKKCSSTSGTDLSH